VVLQIEEYAVLSTVALSFFGRMRDAQVFTGASLGASGRLKDSQSKLTIGVRDIGGYTGPGRGAV
jgi:hypothetical protein